MKDEDKPWVDNYPPLKKWLDRIGARCMWQVKQGTSHVEGWMVNQRIFILEVYANKHGWNIWTDGNSSDISETLRDAERRLGLGLELA